MNQHKNNPNPELPKPGEGVISTEMIIDKELPSHGMSVDITQDLTSELGEESTYVDDDGNKAPIILASTVYRHGKAPMPLAIFRQQIRGGAEDGKTQLLVMQGNERIGYQSDVLEIGQPYAYKELGISLAANEAGTWLNIKPTGQSKIEITANVPKTRPFNDEYGPLAR